MTTSRSKPKRGPKYAVRAARRRRAFIRAKWLSQFLLRTLGGRCAQCGTEDLTLLTVDHVDGVTYDRYQLRYDARVERYISEFCEGVRLRALCMVCNGRFGRMAQMREPGEDDEGLDTDTTSVTETLPEAPF